VQVRLPIGNQQDGKKGKDKNKDVVSLVEEWLAEIDNFFWGLEAYFKAVGIEHEAQK